MRLFRTHSEARRSVISAKFRHLFSAIADRKATFFGGPTLTALTALTALTIYKTKESKPKNKNEQHPEKDDRERRERV